MRVVGGHADFAVGSAAAFTAVTPRSGGGESVVYSRGKPGQLCTSRRCSIGHAPCASMCTPTLNYTHIMHVYTYTRHSRNYAHCCVSSNIGKGASKNKL